MKNAYYDYFVDEYYNVLSQIDKNKAVKEEFKTFRESDEQSIYQGIAIEVAQENHCQLSCQWCYINQSERKNLNKPITYDVVKEIIDKISIYNKKNNRKLFSNIVFIGGEPTLNPELPKMITYSLDNGLNPIVVTNGLKLSDMEYAKKICKSGVVVTTHLPFFSKGDKYNYLLDKLCKCSGYSQKLKQAIHNMIEITKEVKNFEIVGEMVLNNATVPYAFESYVFCRQNNIDPFFEFMRISNDHYSNKELVLNKEDLKSFVTKVYEYDLEHGFVEKNDVITKTRYYLPPAINKPCTMIQNSIHVKYTQNGFGDIISCCGQDIIHGNIMVNSLEEIIENKENTFIFSKQNDYIKGPCSVCELYALAGCEGGCRGNAKNVCICAEASDPQCIFIKDEVKENINIMCSDRCFLYAN